jgi:hypothetical protein
VYYYMGGYYYMCKCMCMCVCMCMDSTIRRWDVSPFVAGSAQSRVRAEVIRGYC